MHRAPPFPHFSCLGAYPETVAVNLWGLDAIKTKGESVGIVLRLVGARCVVSWTVPHRKLYTTVCVV